MPAGKPEPITLRAVAARILHEPQRLSCLRSRRIDLRKWPGLWRKTSPTPQGAKQNRMTNQHPLDAFGTRLRDLIERGFPPDDDSFNRLAHALFSLQFEHNKPFQEFCRHRGLAPGCISDWHEIPAMPTSAFKELELTSLTRDERTAEFHSSGTSGHRPSRHFHNPSSLAVYEASLRVWFQRHLCEERGVSAIDVASDYAALGRPGAASARLPRTPPGTNRVPLLALTPSAGDAPKSSLAYMIETVIRAVGGPGSRVLGSVDESGSWRLDQPAALTALREFEADERPAILMGTAFSFVHLFDWLEEHDERVSLAEGSRVLETGGYKGRSRELPRAELHRLIGYRLGVPPTHTICEYGMSELSSQAYDAEVPGAQPARSGNCGVRNGAREFRFPPWARTQIVSPETGREVAEGETGLIRVFDLANLRSVAAIQTEDLGVRRDEGFELLGRAALSEVRGCSLLAI